MASAKFPKSISCHFDIVSKLEVFSLCAEISILPFANMKELRTSWFFVVLLSAAKFVPRSYATPII